MKLPALRRRHRGPRDPNAPRRGPTPGALALIILVASATMVGFGFQQGAFQGQVNDRDACYQQWGEDMTATFVTRSDATSRLDRAREDRDDALDTVALLILTLDQQEPPPTDAEANAQFRRVLLAFADAKTKLDKVSEAVKTTRRTSPYPVLDCTDGDEDGDNGTETEAP